MWSVVLGVVILAGVVWLFVAAVAVGLSEGGADRQLRRNLYLALGLVVISGLGLTLATYL